MSSTFAFGFHDEDTEDIDDLEDIEDTEDDDGAKEDEEEGYTETEDLTEDIEEEKIHIQPHTEVRQDASFIPPQSHTLRELLSKIPSKLSINMISVPSDCHHRDKIPRRSLFDIRAQLMAEDENPSTGSIAGLSGDDIIPKVYEGGLKTWECAVDLANYVWSKVDIFERRRSKDCTIIELGAGTALPTVMLARKWHSQISPYFKQDGIRLQLCLADYNRSVLEVSTIPNFFLGMRFLDDNLLMDPEINTPPSALRRFQDCLAQYTISASAVSGSWTPGLADRILSSFKPLGTRPHETVVLASETIYSPASIQNFTTTLLRILRKAQLKGSRARAFVAAKRVYFGVGGGTDEFMKVLTCFGGKGRTVWESQGAGVGRVIIEVTVPIN